MQDCIPTSLLKLSADNSTRAVKMFAGVQKYMAEGGEAPAGAAKAELVQKLLHQVCLSVCNAAARTSEAAERCLMMQESLTVPISAAGKPMCCAEARSLRDGNAPPAQCCVHRRRCCLC